MANISHSKPKTLVHPSSPRNSSFHGPSLPLNEILALFNTHLPEDLLHQIDSSIADASIIPFLSARYFDGSWRNLILWSPGRWSGGDIDIISWGPAVMACEIRLAHYSKSIWEKFFCGSHPKYHHQRVLEMRPPLEFPDFALHNLARDSSLTLASLWELTSVPTLIE